MTLEELRDAIDSLPEAERQQPATVFIEQDGKRWFGLSLVKAAEDIVDVNGEVIAKGQPYLNL